MGKIALVVVCFLNTIPLMAITLLANLDTVRFVLWQLLRHHIVSILILPFHRLSTRLLGLGISATLRSCGKHSSQW
jgi:hypothetical protein